MVCKGSGRNFKPLIVYASIAACIIVIGILLAAFLFRSSYETPIKEAVDILNDRSTELKDVYKFYKDGPEGDYMYEYRLLLEDMDKEISDREKAEETIEEMYDDFSDIYGEDWEVTCEIKRARELKGSSLEEIEEYWDNMLDKFDDIVDNFERLSDFGEISEEEYEKLVEFHYQWQDDLKEMEVTEGYKLKVKLTIEGEYDKRDETEEIIVFKLGGKWIVQSGFRSFVSSFAY